jgi:branched-chain amino acid transport system ATP-binding protein
MLEICDVKKCFGGLAALDKVSFSVEKGQIFGLIGPNGSGKTTLFNCIGGVYKVTEGAILFQGKHIENLPSHVVCHAGIGRTYQNVRPFSNLTVYDNIRAGCVFSRKQHTGKKNQRERIMEIIGFVGLTGKEEQRAGGLPLALRKRLEIGRALVSNPELLLLDEVAAGLNLVESQEIISLVRKIHDRGTTILMVEHVMPIIMNVCHRIVVLADGCKIAEGEPAAISNDTRVIESYLGVEAMKEVAANG